MSTILLAIDAYTQLDRLLPAALLLGTQHHAGLVGRFSQDSRLMQGAALPFTREVGANSAACYPLTSEAIEKRVRRIADGMRRRLAAEAERKKLPWDFQLCYGSISQTITEAKAEVVLPGWCENLWTMTKRPCLSKPNAVARPVNVVVDDGSPSSVYAIESARRLNEAIGPQPLVILASNCGRDASTEPPDFNAEKKSEEVTIGFASQEQLLRQLHLLRPTLVLLGRDQPLADDRQLHKELAFMNCPLALLRTTRQSLQQTE